MNKFITVKYEKALFSIPEGYYNKSVIVRKGTLSFSSGTELIIQFSIPELLFEPKLLQFAMKIY
jgi:hypothetical protein